MTRHWCKVCRRVTNHWIVQMYNFWTHKCAECGL